MNRLDERVAIVTGGAKGIGQAFCVGLAKEGAKVAVADLLDGSETVEKVKAVGGEALALKVDVTSEASTQEMAQQVMDHFGRIDILVNNAGIYPALPFQDMSFEDWKRVLAVNLDGIFLCTKAVYPHMMAQHYGRIVNISSGTVFLGSPNFAHYVTTKAGVIGFTRTLATEAGEYGITVNAIAPGLTATRTVVDGPLGTMLEGIIQMQALKRRQEPEDLVGALLFFVTDEGAFVTGQTIAVDGGLARH
jgi:NAD(P)-dependent dehydrogenase (short-subunit alcohol dehydrogenase family)